MGLADLVSDEGGAKFLTSEMSQMSLDLKMLELDRSLNHTIDEMIYAFSRISDKVIVKHCKL